MPLQAFALGELKLPKFYFSTPKTTTKNATSKMLNLKKIYKLAKLIEMNSFNYDVKNKRCDLSWVMKWCVKVYKVSFWGSKLVFFFFFGR